MQCCSEPKNAECSFCLSLTLTIVAKHNPPIVMVEIMAAEPALHGAVRSVSFEAAWYVSSTRCTFSLFGPYLIRWTWTVFASAHVAWLQIPPSPFQCWRILTHPYEVFLLVAFVGQFRGCQVKEMWLHAHFLKMQNGVACDNCDRALSIDAHRQFRYCTLHHCPWGFLLWILVELVACGEMCRSRD